MSTWRCHGIYPKVPPCDAHGTNDKDAEHHTKATTHATGPDIGCYITMPGRQWNQQRHCGEPVVSRGLCEKHLGDWERLGGVAS